ncbi:CU044_5270 family protein [Actinomadura sp. 6N118]|uniref:CU044_5270 family protein n=1 Tax=Actinomadura sp. 6N118 TaxID=3375151 RepID=UPI0037B2B4C3
MDELDLIENVFTEPEATSDVAAAGRARLMALAAETPATTAGAASPGAGIVAPGRGLRALRGARARWTLGAGLLPLAAAVTAAAVIAGSDVGSVPQPQDTPARRVLLAAATRSEATPVTGRYLRFSTENHERIDVGTAKRPYRVVYRTLEEFWYPTKGGTPGWSSYRSLGGEPVSRADAAAWRAAGSPRRLKERCDDNRIVGYKGGEIRPDGSVSPEIPIRGRCRWFDLRPGPAQTERMASGTGMHGQPSGDLNPATLSDDPATLRRQLLAWTRAGGLAGPVEGDSAQLWAAAGTLITEPVGLVRPKLRAAAYRVLADLPDVRSLGEVTDQRGRRGQALERTGAESEGVSGNTDRTIIDPRTGAPLAAESYEKGPGGRLLGFDLVTHYEYTDQAPKA